MLSKTIHKVFKLDKILLEHGFLVKNEEINIKCGHNILNKILKNHYSKNQLKHLLFKAITYYDFCSDVTYSKKDYLTDKIIIKLLNQVPKFSIKKIRQSIFKKNFNIKKITSHQYSAINNVIKNNKEINQCALTKGIDDGKNPDLVDLYETNDKLANNFYRNCRNWRLADYVREYSLNNQKLTSLLSIA